EEIWAKRCRAFLRDHNLASSLESYVRRFEGPLAARLDVLGDAVATGEIGIDAGGLHVPRLKAEPVDPAIRRTRDALYARIGPVPSRRIC
ncbi:MAG: hypothetical protein AAFV30_10415, partial [Pseudomonadota bacterium]